MDALITHVAWRAALAVLAAATIRAGDPQPLFDGRSFKGWEGDTNRTWRIEDEAIVGGSLATTIPRNEFLVTTRSFTNFVLRLQFKLVGSEGFVNAGVQVRSERVADPPNEMRGYQADLGEGYYGALYDESRRDRILAQPEAAAVRAALRTNDWNQYEIRCEGPRLRTRINDQWMMDYRESDPAIPQHGRIGLQIHGGAKAEVRYRRIVIEEL